MDAKCGHVLFLVGKVEEMAKDLVTTYYSAHEEEELLKKVAGEA